MFLILPFVAFVRFVVHNNTEGSILMALYLSPLT